MIQELMLAVDEIKRLRTDNRSHETKLAYYADKVERLQAELAQAADFLDGMADDFEAEPDYGIGLRVVASDCRTMAKKLRGEK